MSDTTNKTAQENAATEEKTQAEQSAFIIKFAKPYTFESKSYTEIDLSGMENLAATDLFTASKIFATEGYISSKPETDPKFCCMIATLATGLPKEFFNRLPIKEANKVKEMVFDFFQDAD